ncbi:MAG: helix-turn-helix domain-containing protein [Actinobacteria bacterium]|nr:helix-turn-helix domain-containing protein [Actinomycetota bacterium]
MITNERQYKITKAQLDKLEQASAELNIKESTDALADLSARALASEIEVLRSQLLEYEELKAGLAAPVLVTSLSDLPCAMIRARIAAGMTQRELAEALGWKEQQIQRYEATDYSSASLRRLLDVAAVLGLDVADKAEEASDSRGLHLEDSREIDWEKFPVKEMYRRHWFEGFQGSLDAAIRTSETLVRDYVQSVVRRPALALHRKHVRSGDSLDEYALLAWESRVLHLAASAGLDTKYVHGSMTSTWLREFIRLSRYDDGPVRAREALAKLGIAMVVEPHMPGTYLDGAGLLQGDHAVVALTLRYDRVDNFWFVLLHELAHIDRHLRRGKLTGAFDDLEAGGGDRVEEEADSIATEALLPGSSWDLALARYVRSKESVLSFADELRVSPAIVAGRIRHEANNYIILADLVGSGMVRRLFSEVEFSA